MKIITKLPPKEFYLPKLKEFPKINTTGDSYRWVDVESNLLNIHSYCANPWATKYQSILIAHSHTSKFNKSHKNPNRKRIKFRYDLKIKPLLPGYDDNDENVWCKTIRYYQVSSYVSHVHPNTFTFAAFPLPLQPGDEVNAWLCYSFVRTTPEELLSECSEDDSLLE